MSNKETEKSFSGRNFMKMAGIAVVSLILGTYLGTLLPVDTAETEQGGSAETEEQNDEASAAQQLLLR